MSSARPIHIKWTLYQSLDDVLASEAASQPGLYQYYGQHPVYGADRLLYIGKAVGQGVSERLMQHVHDAWSSVPVKICFGEILSNSINDDSTVNQISLAESLLIYSHSPCWNSSNVKSIAHEEYGGVHIFNWGEYAGLLPEISYARWSGIGNKVPANL